MFNKDMKEQNQCECGNELSTVIMGHPSGVKAGDKMCSKCNRVYIASDWKEEYPLKSLQGALRHDMTSFIKKLIESAREVTKETIINYKNTSDRRVDCYQCKNCNFDRLADVDEHLNYCQNCGLKIRKDSFTS